MSGSSNNGDTNAEELYIGELSDWKERGICSQMSEVFVPIGLLGRTKDDNWYFRDMNICMANILKEGSISSKGIIDSKIFKKMIEKMDMSIGMVKYRDKAYNINYFYLSAVPIMNNKIISEVLIYMISLGKDGIFKRELFDNLTNRQKKVMALAMEGMENKLISSMLKVSEGTVKRELYDVYKRLGVNSRVEAFLKLYEL